MMRYLWNLVALGKSAPESGRCDCCGVVSTLTEYTNEKWYCRKCADHLDAFGWAEPVRR